MKKILGVLTLFCALGLSIPAAYAGSSPNVWGFVYQNTITPGDGFNNVAPTKEGSATCRNYFYVVGVGNCSVKQAMRNGGITQLSHYDIERHNILGVQRITVKAYGR